MAMALLKEKLKNVVNQILVRADGKISGQLDPSRKREGAIIVSGIYGTF
jgi:hypothetical protein